MITYAANSKVVVTSRKCTICGMERTDGGGGRGAQPFSTKLVHEGAYSRNEEREKVEHPIVVDDSAKKGENNSVRQ